MSELAQVALRFKTLEQLQIVRQNEPIADSYLPDIHYMFQSLDSLPEAWLRQFASSLPAHLKARVRCCNRKLQGLIDELGIGWSAANRCNPKTALQLAAQYLTSLTTTQLAVVLPFEGAEQQQQQLELQQEQHGQSSAHNSTAKASTTAQLATSLRQLPCGLPALRKLTINLLHQADVLAAVLSCRPPLLSHMKLCDKQQGVEFAAEELQQRCSILQQLPELAPILFTLEVDFRTYRLAQQYINAALSHPPHLHTLILSSKLSAGHAADCSPVISAQTWTSVIQPLLATLTRLEIGSRQLGESQLDRQQDRLMLVPANSQPAASTAQHHTSPSAGQSVGHVETAADPAVVLAGGAGEPSTLSTTTSAGAAIGSSSSADDLGRLLRLTCRGLDGPWDDSWCLNWVSGCSSLTTLHLSLCSAGELDFEVLAQLRQLQSLTLHYYEDEYITAAQLGPLSACCKLTQLKVEGLLIELPPPSVDVAAMQRLAHAAAEDALQRFTADRAAAREGRAGGVPATGLDGGNPDHAAHPPAIAAVAPAAAEGLSAQVARLPSGMALQQLTSLQRLTAGLMCKAPLATLAPNLTRLCDNDYDLATLDLPCSFLPEQLSAGQEGLAGLTALQVLRVNIFAVVRHAVCPANLSGLRELHVEMVGSMEGSCIDPGGLPCLPQLTKLVMTIDTKVHRNLSKTYTTSEDYLLWRNQAAVRHLRLRGSALLGGFLVEQPLLQQLPAAMPDLHRVEVVRARELTAEQLTRFVAARACRSVLVQGCVAISERDCVQAQDAVGGDVQVEYSW